WFQIEFLRRHNLDAVRSQDVNTAGVIVGVYRDSAGLFHGSRTTVGCFERSTSPAQPLLGGGRVESSDSLRVHPSRSREGSLSHFDADHGAARTPTRGRFVTGERKVSDRSSARKDFGYPESPGRRVRSMSRLLVPLILILTPLVLSGQ